MSKKITKEIFLSRFYKSYPDSKIEIIEYSAITKPARIKCSLCGKEHYKKSANKFISDFSCCNSHNESKYKKIEKILNDSLDFDLIKKIDKDNVIVYHKKCGNEFKRSIQSILLSPDACKYCNTIKEKNMLNIEEVQNILNNSFGDIKILDYQGQLEKNHYKCLKCGLIFIRSQVSMMASRGCPKCDALKSKGEKLFSKILEEKNIEFKEQVSVKELPLQHFDFAIYEKGELKCYVEINGEQHYTERGIFDNLKITQERDNKKRLYCKNNNIPLYEIKWFKGKFLNLDILPF